jgi:hypothetical protein
VDVGGGVAVVVLRALALGVLSSVPTDLGPRGAAEADRMDLASPAAHPRAVAIETLTGPPFSDLQVRVRGKPPSWVAVTLSSETKERTHDVNDKKDKKG